MKVLITGRLPEDLLVRVRLEHEVIVNERDEPMSRNEILRHCAEIHGLLCMVTDVIDAHLIKTSPNLKMIANYGVGYDNIDIPAATSAGIKVSNTPGVLTDATADLTLALILAVARRLVEGDKLVRAGRFHKWSPMTFLGRDVSGKTLGIIGLGRIGKAVARRARAFDMRILYHNRHRLSAEEEHALSVTYADLKSLISESDFVSLHVNLTHETRHLIGSEELALMKPSAYLINASRGPVVDEKALVRALSEGLLAGAGLDVFENEPELAPGLADFDNVVIVPHIGSATVETRYKMAAVAVENLMAGLRGDTPPNCLNC
ncbi:MAG: D-glycerate dehydrogenase [Thermodesulfobacteriota bacterium]